MVTPKDAAIALVSCLFRKGGRGGPGQPYHGSMRRQHTATNSGKATSIGMICFRVSSWIPDEGEPSVRYKYEVTTTRWGSRSILRFLTVKVA